jgi:hypothetical protein
VEAGRRQDHPPACTFFGAVTPVLNRSDDLAH